MIIKLSIEDHPDKGFVLQYKEEGINNDPVILSDSTSRILILQRYRKARNCIDHRCFTRIEEGDYINNTYCKFRAVLEYIDNRGLNTT